MTTTPSKRKPVTKTVARKPITPLRLAAADGPVKGDNSLHKIARDLRSWTDFVLGIANTAADLSFQVAASRLSKPAHKAAGEKAGGLFRDLREGAGLTLADLGRAINLKDVT